MTRVRSFSFLIVSFLIFYKGMYIPVCVLKEKKKEKKKGGKEKRKIKRWAVLKTVSRDPAAHSKPVLPDCRS